MADEIAIGYSLSENGRFASAGAKWYRQSHELWAEQCNARGGILGQAVHLVRYDDESKPEKAAENYRRLIEDDGISILLGPCHTALMGAVTPVAEEHDALLLQGTHGSYGDFEKGLKHQFLCWPGCDFDYPKPFIDRFARHHPGASMAIIHTNGRIGKTVARGARQHAKSQGLTVVHDEEITDAPFDYDALMRRVAATEPDALVIGLDHGRNDNPRASCLTAAHQAGIAADRIWHSDNPATADLALGAANEGVSMRITWVPEIADPRSRQFVADYRATFGEEPEFHCAGGFACGEVLEQAAAACKTWKAEALHAAILRGSFNTVCGKLTFQGNGLPNSALHVGRWTNGALTIVED